jgi:hypothetical protein
VKSENDRLNNASLSVLIMPYTFKGNFKEKITLIDKATLSKMVACFQKFYTECVIIGVLRFVCVNLTASKR